MVDFSDRKLGKRAPAHDPRTLLLLDFWDGTPVGAIRAEQGLPAPPATDDETTKVQSYPTDGNDVHGDCVLAGIAHVIQTMRANAGLPPANISTATVLRWYSQVTNPPFDPATGANDNGTVMLNALNYWRTTGFVDDDGVVHQIGAYVAFEPTVQEQYEAAIYFFDGALVGIALPVTAQTQTTWDIVGDGKTGTSAPGSWGGHCVPDEEYDASLMRFPTWGEVLSQTWRFAEHYTDEAYAVISQEQLDAGGHSERHMDWTALQQALAEITQPPDPGPPPWQPDPNILALNTALDQDEPYMTSLYRTGDVAGYRQWFASLRAALDDWAPYVAGTAVQPPRLPARSPELPRPTP